MVTQVRAVAHGSRDVTLSSCQLTTLSIRHQFVIEQVSANADEPARRGASRPIARRTVYKAGH